MMRVTIAIISCPPGFADAGGSGNENERENQHGDAERAAVVEIEDRAVLLKDEYRKYRDAPATEQGRRDIGADREREDDDRARHESGQAERKGNRPEGLRGRR